MPWTENQNGDPFCWVHPSHKIGPGDPMNKHERLEIALSVLAWFEFAMEYLDKDAWTFAVDKSGKYLPGKPSRDKPEDFELVRGAWSLRLRVLSTVERIPHRPIELTEARKELHKVVTILLMNLAGSAKAGKWLKPFRASYDLPNLRKVDIWGKQGLLF